MMLLPNTNRMMIWISYLVTILANLPTVTFHRWSFHNPHAPKDQTEELIYLLDLECED